MATSMSTSTNRSVWSTWRSPSCRTGGPRGWGAGWRRWGEGSWGGKGRLSWGEGGWRWQTRSHLLFRWQSYQPVALELGGDHSISGPWRFSASWERVPCATRCGYLPSILQLHFSLISFFWTEYERWWSYVAFSPVWYAECMLKWVGVCMGGRWVGGGGGLCLFLCLCSRLCLCVDVMKDVDLMWLPSSLIR